MLDDLYLAPWGTNIIEEASSSPHAKKTTKGKKSKTNKENKKDLTPTSDKGQTVTLVDSTPPHNTQDSTAPIQDSSTDETANKTNVAHIDDSQTAQDDTCDSPTDAYDIVEETRTPVNDTCDNATDSTYNPLVSDDNPKDEKLAVDTCDKETDSTYNPLVSDDNPKDEQLADDTCDNNETDSTYNTIVTDDDHPEERHTPVDDTCDTPTDDMEQNKPDEEGIAYRI
ncbi:glutamate--tRNA ligase-like [Branchiostoma lanceolatum]|uniref:glutamate--tRNA ligase-like n=1 Tax=Branchiostoma lanceolatum TaxID=7740 RepID=UPI003455CAAB